MSSGDSDEKATASRSPRYPAFALEEAIKKVRAIYDADKTAGTPTMAAFKHIGYKGKSGPATAAIAALKRFGLITATTGRVSPTKRAVSIMILPDSDQRRKDALREAALHPTLYRRFYDEYKDHGLPSDESFEQELILGGEFNPNAVKAFVKDFRASLKFAGLIGDNGVLLDSVPGDEDENNEDHGADSNRRRGDDQRGRIKRSRNAMSVGLKEDVCSLEEGEAIFQWPDNLSADSASDLEEWLKFIGKKIKRAAGKASAADPADDPGDDDSD